MPHFRFRRWRRRFGSGLNDVLRRLHIQEHHGILLLVMTGLLVSLLFLGRMDGTLWETVKMYSESALQRTVGIEGTVGIASEKLLQKRLCLPFLWLLLSGTAWGIGVLYVSWIALGFSAGTLIWTVLAVSGWRGPFLVWTLVFPQYLCYVPALFLWHISGKQWHKMRRQYRSGEELRASQLQKNASLHWLPGRVFLGILLYGAGIWLELYINQWILQKNFINL